MTAPALYSHAKVQSIEIDGKDDVITLRPVVESNLFNSLGVGDDYTFQTTVNGKSFTFEAVVDDQGPNITLELENDDAAAIVEILDQNNDNKISDEEFEQGMENAVVSYEEDIRLHENHSLDSQVKLLLEAEDVVFQYDPIDGNPGELLFGQSIVSVGADKQGNILSFICPQRSFNTSLQGYTLDLTGEVEVGQVGGAIDPITGEGNIYADELKWLFWGSITTPSGSSYGITKDEAAFIPIRDTDNNSGLLTLASIEKSAHGSGNIENVFSSYFVSGQQGSTAQDNFLNTLMIEGVNLLHPGLATEGTAIQWNIDLQHPIPISGSDYEDIAHSLHMGH
ncbi:MULTISPECIES: hypothetical protein [Prochlorococcus]|uniref:hypothetical protein n=1 Tax=Prochlorococcus TaxID=1218 RepID=UPI0007B3E826|nr:MULTISPECIES: hypothetical protein [Prochlorococcus]KZR62524.1 hypothetical protein PMIT1312_01990 [Prochlorococcus marinus str. MIT 1312]KZR80993.1 hypothetical protein PMIT1327_01441 [Prochlorococcus marinus str. MIT 1327]NMO83185.1 hypothetical protein [Prochlorococcus sp. P1344]NMP05246.1 hypothetical protein [Prochlorococcus sp. P1361]NMP13261.1 hypothetical protein [Prochlorococcus sp.P1363]